MSPILNLTEIAQAVSVHWLDVLLISTDFQAGGLRQEPPLMQLLMLCRHTTL